MLGAIIGDIVGSRFEGSVLGTTEFELFTDRSTPTDDSVLTVATAEVLMDGGDYAEAYRRYTRRYPGAGFGSSFFDWAFSEGPPERPSWGNGGAMRVSPVGWAASTLDDALTEAARSAAPTHGHAEGVAGAQAIASAVYLARTGASRDELHAHVTTNFGYDLSDSVETMRPSTVRTRESVPHAFVAFLASQDFESAVRNAVFIGGDTDTIASMAGALAEAFYGDVPVSLQEQALARLDEPMRNVVSRFREGLMAR